MTLRSSVRGPLLKSYILTFTFNNYTLLAAAAAVVDMYVCCVELLYTDDSTRQTFYDQLTVMPTSEAIFLLTTFANMACCRSVDEMDLIEVVTSEIFEIAYLCSHTRELCSKPGRQLLESVCSRHPSIISFLLRLTHDSLDRVGLVRTSQTMCCILFICS